MKTLPTEFNKNGMKYRIIDRSETRYLAEVYSLESGNLGAYETGRILRHEGFKIGGRDVEAGENIIGNEAFGKDAYEGVMSPKSKDVVVGWFKEGTISDIRKAKLSSPKQEQDKVDISIDSE
jgi:hypothetical protein